MMLCIYTVRDTNNDIVYQNYDFSNPTFTGDKWARLGHNGNDGLSVDIYSEAGDYSIEFCAVDYTSGYDDSLSAELGVLSGFLIRASRKHVINLSWVDTIEPWFNGGLMVILKGGEKVEVSRRQAAKFKDMMSL